MPRVGCDAKPTRTTGWCPKTRPAPIITQQARVTGPLMVQCWYSFDDAGTTLSHQWVNVSCLLGTQLPVRKGCFFYNYFILRISQFISLHVMTNDEIE